MIENRLVDTKEDKKGRWLLVVGAAVFLAAFAAEIQQDHSWYDIVAKPSILFTAVGKLAGWVTSVYGASKLLPKEV